MIRHKTAGQAGAVFGTIVAIIAVFVVLFLVFGAWQTIQPGYVGIVFNKSNHTVQSGALEPGWTMINPFTTAIQQYPVTVRTYDMVAQDQEGTHTGDDSVKVQSNEGQQLNLDVVVQYQVKKEDAGALYQDWGGAPIETIEDRVVRQYTRSAVPVVASKYGWEGITSSKREQINTEISTALTTEFGKRHLQLVSFAIREVHLPQALQAALDQKIKAQQAAEQQKYQLEQAQIKAQQDVAEATGHANALKAQAEGEAAATLTRAKAQAEANRQLAQSLTPALIEYQKAQKWDGKLPVMTGGTTPMVNATDIISGTR